ncbi:peroxidasin [Bactrocera neohumeralis]|uniref:peroxidasin n=1 Tax=Bactrocera neohumeralis TaxID=98809 RepID=UPI002165F824|nr:peroxidasin [Bactrocera neohumeralis]
MQKAFLIIFTLFCIYENTAGKVGNNKCPIGCTCHVRTMRCEQAGLDSIPENISNDVQMIDLRDNNLHDIPAAAFRGLPFVTTLFLNYNGITTIDKNAFVDLSNLKQLYLGNNKLKDISVDLLQPLKNVKVIYLDNNMIAKIHKGTFSHLLDLSYLSLNNNELVNIPSDEFTYLPRLQYLQIDNNPLTCDCAVHALWNNYFNGPEKTINQIILSCGSSSATNKKFANLEPQDFECNIPEIILAPENQLVVAGKSLTLECDADGEPEPVIKWYFNGKPLKTDERKILDNENTELNINNVIKNDTGIYTCIAQNYNGNVSIQANVTVYDSEQKPRLIIEPYDLEVILGTIFEIPCKAEDHNGVQVIWRHDGKVITENIFSNDKYQVSGSGSLLVKNVTTADGGRYECTLKNQYGRVTASALVKVKGSVSKAPGDNYVRIAFNEALMEIDLAINNTIDALFTKRNRNSNGTPNYADLLRVFRFPKGEARQLARAAEIYERTLVNIRKHIAKGDALSTSSESYEFKDLLSREHLHLLAELSGCVEHREMPNCTDMCYHSRYRSIDGTCNNMKNPWWGASLTAFKRNVKPIYENGFSTPVGWTKKKLYGGFLKPSSRLISTSVITTKRITPDNRITHMVMQWGQFLDHDLDHALPSVSSESWDGIDCKKTCDYAPPCFPIEVPPGDPRIKNRRCIDVIRTSSVCGSGMTSVFFEGVQHREQINQLTSYIDASQVYGYSYEFSVELRNLTTDDGLLRTGVQFPGQKDMLPFAAPQDGMDCRRNLNENTMNCFVAGDIRVNEQIGLLAMHTIWMREHNRIAIKLRDLNPHWDGDTIYQEARKIVGAQMQHITYKHWLPLIVGESGMKLLGEYKGYDPNIDPSISNVFATAALRFGHTIINPVLHRLNSTFQPIPQGHLPLHKAFFAPWRLAYEGGVDPLIRGMFSIPAKLKTPEENLNSELTEKLFQSSHAVALDLAAINIQRSRDHGLPGYNVYRKFCNLSTAVTFDDMENYIKSADVRRKLKEIYGHPDNIDVWVGGILEDQIEDGKVGPLFQCLLVEQFRRLRDGDRFYYENSGVFLPQQLNQIKQANLGRILCDNGDKMNEITSNVFLLPKVQGGFKKCADMPEISLNFWQDCGSCKSLPPLLEESEILDYHALNKRSTHSIKNTFKQSWDFKETQQSRINSLEETINKLQNEFEEYKKRVQNLEN